MRKSLQQETVEVDSNRTILSSTKNTNRKDCESGFVDSVSFIYFYGRDYSVKKNFMDGPSLHNQVTANGTAGAYFNFNFN